MIVMESFSQSECLSQASRVTIVLLTATAMPFLSAMLTEARNSFKERGPCKMHFSLLTVRFMRCFVGEKNMSFPGETEMKRKQKRGGEWSQCKMLRRSHLLFPYAGMILIRFRGYNLSPPSADTPKVFIPASIRRKKGGEKEK
jgi:hypothetical protein